MNRTRYNYLRPDREMEGLHQVSQMPQPTNSHTPLRKTTYTRAELMQRGTTTNFTNRSKRLPTLNTGKCVSPRPVAIPSEVAANRRTSTTTRTHFLPRVAKLAGNNNCNTYINSNNNNSYNNSMDNNRVINTGKALTRDKSPTRKHVKSCAYLNSACDSSSVCARGQKLPQQHQHQQQPQQHQQHQLQHQQQQQLQLLSSIGNSCSASSSMSNSSTDLRRIKLAKAFRLPDEQNKSFVYLCKPVKQVKELLMVRSLRNSVEDLVKDQQLNDPSDIFDDANAGSPSLIIGESDNLSYCSSLNLQQDVEMNRYQDMLQTQLQDVRQRELQLQQLAAKVQLEQSSEREPEKERERDKNRDRDRDKKAEQQKEKEKEQVQVQEQAQRNCEMEFVCQNIPTLQREIKLLQQLGEKLEATLRANIQRPATTPRSTPQSGCTGTRLAESCTVFYTPRSTLNIFGYEALPIVRMGWRLEEHVEHMTQRCHVVYPLRCFGCIREFRIETKTLTELKTADETQCFYLPLAEDGGLQRTSFRKLRENPNVLLQQLRPLTPARPFNLLEQDAMFFNSMLSHTDVQLINANNNFSSAAATAAMDQLLPRETGGQNQLSFALTAPYTRLSLRPLCLKDTLTWTTADVERMLVSTVNATVQCEIPPAESPRSEESSSRVHGSIKCRQSIRWKCPKLKPTAMPLPKIGTKQQRKLVVRQVAPLKPQREEMEPEMQTQLLKTVLVGIVQVAVFLVLIMAFTYPDIRC